MRVADYIFQTLADRGTKHVFLVTGGGAMHLNDALRREKRLRYICCLHEQACAMAAEGYARIAGSPGIVSVTTGPGGTNALTGVLGAWVDSIPMLVISSVNDVLGNFKRLDAHGRRKKVILDEGENHLA